MGKKVTIIMYHYVREILKSRYPDIKGLEVSSFKGQLGYLKDNYQIITMQEVIHAIKSGHDLPANAALLTFDDGFMDHFNFVFPVLHEFKLQGSFFPPVKPIKEHQVLNVHKIHFILASVKDKRELIKEIFSVLDDCRGEYQFKSNEELYKELAVECRYDNKEIMFIKKIFQRELPEKLRDHLLAKLFVKYVTEDEGAFSRELYMSEDQIKCMYREGMFIGSHGYDHYWLDTLSSTDQAKEIDGSLAFLKEIGCNVQDWVICYPFGAFNASLLSLLKDRGCALGLTTEPRIADIGQDDYLRLPRLDTNDFPIIRGYRKEFDGLQSSIKINS